MSPEELGQIIRKGFLNMRLAMSDSVHQKIIILSHGLPHYTHLLALESGKAALDRNSNVIEDADLMSALDQVVRSKHSVANEYYSAVRSAHKASKHKMTLLACALTKTDIQGFFQAPDAAVTMATLLGEGIPVPDIQKHLAEFAALKRGNVLEREGSFRKFRYRFSNSLLQPYTIISSLSEKLVTGEKVWALQ
jgi:hypothetical protein